MRPAVSGRLLSPQTVCAWIQINSIDWICEKVHDISHSVDDGSMPTPVSHAFDGLGTMTQVNCVGSKLMKTHLKSIAAFNTVLFKHPRLNIDWNRWGPNIDSNRYEFKYDRRAKFVIPISDYWRWNLFASRSAWLILGCEKVVAVVNGYWCWNTVTRVSLPSHTKKTCCWLTAMFYQPKKSCATFEPNRHLLRFRCKF